MTMEQIHKRSLSMRKNYLSVSRRCLVAAIGCVLVASAGCGTSIRPEKTYPAGSTVDVGSLSYSVTNTEWANSLEGQAGPRVPRHKFAVVTLSVTNKKSDAATLPLLSMVDATGQQYLESDSGEGLSNWLGLFRNIDPNGSDGGQIVFDLPAGKGPYKLRVSSGGEVDKEVTALIEVPDEKASPASGPLPSPAGQ